MNIVQPSTFLLVNSDNIKHVATCASYCYNSNPSEYARMYMRLIENGHLSMLRHATYYFRVPTKVLSGYYVQYFRANPYCHITKAIDKHYYLVLNGQFYYENPDIVKKSGIFGYHCDVTEFTKQEESCKLVRLTFVCDTQIAISRELNRVSPNNISERSTRYIDFLRKLGIRFSTPHWYEGLGWYRKCLANLLMKAAGLAYNIARSPRGLNLKAEDARYFLPLGVETRVAYTYTIHEWENIIEKRYHDSTGKAHPDAKIAVKPIHDYIHLFMVSVRDEA